MKTNRSFENSIQVVWDGTSLELAQTCLRKYYYSMIRQIKPKNVSVHLLFGGLYASALEHYYKRRAIGESHQQALREVVRETLIKSWNHELTESGERIAGTGFPKSFDHTAKTRPNLIRTIVWYLEQFGEETDDGIKTYHLADGTPAVELSFTLNLDDDIIYAGHLDRVVTYANQLYIMDQKTSGSTIGPYYFNQFSPNNQMSGYTWAGKTILKSPVTGVIIDAAQIAVNFSDFARGITTRTEPQLQEWRESALYTISLAQSATALQKFPMNLSACGNYGGCPFRGLCSQDPRMRESYIKTDFEEHIWDPAVAR